MEPAVLGGRLASALLQPLVRKLFVPDGPGAGLVDRPVRLRNLVSFRGEKRTLGEEDVRKLAGRLVAELGAMPADVGRGDHSRTVPAHPEGDEYCVLGPV